MDWAEVSFNPSLLVEDTVNIAYNQTITPANGTGSLTFAVSKITGTIPGLNLPTSGTSALVITGTPTATGTEAFTVMATDAVGATGSRDYTIIVNPGVQFPTASLAVWTANLAGYSQTLSAVGGTAPFTFGVASGSLPPGLTLSASGLLSGTPTDSGSFNFTVTATDAASASASQTFSVVINPAVSIATATLQNWTANVSNYQETFSASGGTGSLTFSATGGLPPGLMLSGSGVLSGMPTTAGTYPFAVTASDALGASTSQNYSITINTALMLNPGVLPSSPVNRAYNQTLSVTGGTGSVALAVSNVASAIPGLNVPSGGTGSLAISGTPTATGTETFTITATDAVGASAMVNYSLTIIPATVYLTLPTSGFTAQPGGTITGFPISINELQDQASTNHVGLASATLAIAFPTGVFNIPVGGNLASADVSLGSVPLSDTVSPGGASDWTLSANSPADGQLNVTITAKSGKSITTDNPASGGSLVTVNFPISSNFNPGPGTTEAISVVTANGTFHTSILGVNGGYVLRPTPPYSGSVVIAPGPSQYLVNVVGSSVPAGKGVLVSVQAADAAGNAITNYSGPLTVMVTASPTSAATSLPATVPINSSGLGLFLASFQQAGTYTFSVADSSNTFKGSSSPVTVTAGPAAQLAFAAQPVNTATGLQLPPVSVQVEDLYGNAVNSDNLDTVTLGIANGPGSFAMSSIATATVSHGVATFNDLTLITPGTYQLSAVVPGLYTGPVSASFTIAPLQVVPGSFVGTPSGFSLKVNAPFLVDSLTPALYGSGFGTSATVTPTVTLTQTSGTPPSGATLPYQVKGSLVVSQANNGLTFLETGTSSVVNNGTPLLPDGTYVVDITSSGANGLQALYRGGGYLDGTNSGTPGNDFTTTFTVGAAVADDDVVWLPATADGPGQALSAPGMNQLGGGYPVYLNDNSGSVTDVQATLTYNPALLAVTPSSTATFTVTVPSPGRAVLHYSGLAVSAGNKTAIGFLTAMVPAGTTANPMPYKAEDLLSLSGVSLNGGILPVLGGSAVHLLAYIGDADGSGSYSSNDAVLITRALLNTDTGFGAYPLVDPVVVADTDGAGFIPADAALQANEAGVGFATANLPVPPIPSGVHFAAVLQKRNLTTRLFPSALQISTHDPLSQSMLMDASIGSGMTVVSVKTTSVPAAASPRNGASLAAGPTGQEVPSSVALTLAGYSSSKRKRGMLSASLALRAHVLDQYFAGIEVEPDSLASHL
jgi:Putative Ig domain